MKNYIKLIRLFKMFINSRKKKVNTKVKNCKWQHKNNRKVIKKQ